MLHISVRTGDGSLEELIFLISIAADGKNRYWDYDALISMYDFVQLTPELPHKVGYLLSKEVWTLVAVLF